MNRLFVTALVGLAGLGVSACSTSSLALFGADAITQIASGRSISGNVIHAMTGKDCAPLNVLSGKPMCSDDEPASPDEPQMEAYCYRTLGQVDCHSEPDPMMSPTTRLYRAEAAALTSGSGRP